MINNPQAYSIFCDGGSRGNPGPSACAFVVKDKKGEIVYQESKYLGFSTNNQAEYQGVISALTWFNKYAQIHEAQVAVCNFYLDSNLVVNQLNGCFKIKNQGLQKLVVKVKRLERKLKVPVSYYFVKRERNREADKLLNEKLAQHF